MICAIRCCQEMGIAASEIQAALLTPTYQLRAPARLSTFTRTHFDAEQCLPVKCAVQFFSKVFITVLS